MFTSIFCFRDRYSLLHLLDTNLVPRSHCRCENVRSGKVQYKAISGWLQEERLPRSHLFCDWLFPSRFGFKIFSHNSEKNGIKAPVSQLMDEEYYNILYLEQLWFLKKKN